MTLDDNSVSTERLDESSSEVVILVSPHSAGHLMRAGLICLCGCHLGLARGSHSSGSQMVVLTRRSKTIFIRLRARSESFRGTLS